MSDLFNQRRAMARKFALEHRYVDAIAVLDQLCETDPNNAEALIESAGMNARLYNYGDVAARFSQMEALQNVRAEDWLTAAQICVRLHRPDWAKRFFDNAVSEPSAEAWGLFAQFAERSNDLDLAAELVENGLKIDPSNASCQLAKAKLLRRRKAFDLADSVLNSLLANASAPPQAVISGWYELAHLNDERGDYPGAMNAVLRAKELLARKPYVTRLKQRAVGIEQTHHRFLTALTADYFKAIRRTMPTNARRIALLGGHPRSGTTLLEQVLDSHTGIISAAETTVFINMVLSPFLRETNAGNACDAALRIPDAKIEQLRSVYFDKTEAVLDQPLVGRLLVDKNPSLTEAIPEFARIFPEALFIIALRDPRDVVLSCFMQDLALNSSTIRFQTLRETAVRYANVMAMWLACRANMDPSSWIEVRYESLVNDLPGEVGKLMRKLNLDVDPAQFRPDVHAKIRGVHSPTYAQVIQPIHTRAIGRWQRYERWFAEAMPALDPVIKALGY